MNGYHYTVLAERANKESPWLLNWKLLAPSGHTVGTLTSFEVHPIFASKGVQISATVPPGVAADFRQLPTQTYATPVNTVRGVKFDCHNGTRIRFYEPDVKTLAAEWRNRGKAWFRVYHSPRYGWDYKFGEGERSTGAGPIPLDATCSLTYVVESLASHTSSPLRVWLLDHKTGVRYLTVRKP